MNDNAPTTKAIKGCPFCGSPALPFQNGFTVDHYRDCAMALCRRESLLYRLFGGSHYFQLIRGEKAIAAWQKRTL